MHGLSNLVLSDPWTDLLEGARLADEQTFEILLGEFRRVGVDPDTFSAMLAVRPEDALHALRALADGAGPSAFLGQLRQNGIVPPAATAKGLKASSIAKLDQRRRDKSA